MYLDILVRRKYFLFLIFELLLFLALNYKLGFLYEVNKSIYNNMISAFPSPMKTSYKITLVNVQDSSINELSILLSKISSYQPKAIFADIFHQDKKISDLKMQELLQNNKKILFTYPVLKLSPEEIQYPLNYLRHKSFFKKNPSIFGLYDLQNLYTQGAYPSLNFESNVSLVSLISNKNSSKEVNGYVNYNGNSLFLKLSAKDILEENFIPEFFENKIILVSNFNNTYAISPLADTFSLEFLHQTHMAFLIKSTYSGNWLQKFSIYQYFLFFTLFILMWIFLVYKLNNRHSVPLFVVSFLLPISLYWIAGAYFNLLFPLVEMIIITITIDFLLFKHWQNLKHKDESNLLINIANRLQEKIVHKTFFNSEESWKDLSTLINQLFNLNKNILFEKVRGDTRIKEITSYNCDFSDIQEMRRDYTREPYTQAIKNKKITSPSRKFFTTLEKNEKEFIVPLIYNDKVIGFWAFVLDQEEIVEMDNFELVIDSCAKEVSALVHQRNEFILQRDNGEKKLEQILNVEINDENTGKLKRSLAIVEKRMLLTETIFDNIHSKVIIYNLFGKIVQMNEGMNKLLEEEKIASYTLSAGDMLASITELNTTQAKELVRDVIFTKRRHIQFVNLNNNMKKHLLTISSITKNKIADKFSANYIFDTFGILFELVDLSFIEKNYKFKQGLMDKSQARSEERLHDFEDNIKELFENKSYLSSFDYKGSKLEKSVHDIVFMKNKLNNLNEQDLDEDDDLYPVDIIKNLEELINILSSKNEEKQISFKLLKETNSLFVLASVHNLEMHLYSLMLFLINDCEENGFIHINVKEKGESVTIEMKSNGYGIPQEQFSSYLESTTAPYPYTKLTYIKDDIQNWFGSVSYSSRLGDGIVIKLSFLRVDL
ncbi:ATP-binding protein [Sulfurimonas sp. MAG313]|nr:ATP-binding protein [Sulfurimonas sp. MAG313]MDF1881524.1 ATP-binding protein [Sulfurimonas sp. MAG313]